MPQAPEQIHECLACEVSFTLTSALNKNVPLDYASTYCSHECYLSFEDVLAASIEEAKTLGLIDSNGKPINQLDKTQDAVRRIAEQFKLKVDAPGIKLP